MRKQSLCLLSFSLALSLILTSAVDAELVGWWKLDDGSGTIALDSSGNGNDGELQGNPQWVDGQLGGAWQGDGTAAYIQVPHSESLMINDAITVALWLYGGIPPDQVLCKSDGSGAGWQSNYGIRLDDQAPARRINWRGRVVANQSLTSITPVPDNEWVHIACTFDMNGQGNNQRIYINGQMDTENRSTLPLDPGSGDMYIGADQYPVNGVRWWFQGMFDDVRIYDQALPEGQIQAIMLGGGASYPLASRPSPADGAIHEDTWVNLSWSPGDSAVSHDIYLGEDYDDVNSGTADTFRGNQVATFFVAGFPGFPYPDGLVPGTTYYWRIDEVNEADPNSPWKGDVWSFSVPPKTAYNPDPADGAEFVDPNNVTLSWTAGFGAILHTVYLGDDSDEVNDVTGGAPQGTTTYRPGPLELEKVYYWRVDEFDAVATYKGDVWSFTTPGAVGNPQPSYGATDVGMNATLSWTPADSTASHELYFGTDKETVRTADTSSPEYKGNVALGSELYNPGLLEPETTYYWRVDEVDGQGNTAKGPLWIFTTGAFLLVDDFESYTDDDAAGQAIWQTWIDGFGVADNGAQVGYLLPPYAEQTTVHGGTQSMPLLYVNEAGVTNSEASKTLTAPRDWTMAGVAELSLWFRGGSDNATDPLYAAISNSAGAPAVAAHDDPGAATAGNWTQWRIPLQVFADQGIDLTNVDKIAIGLGSKAGPATGGSGTMYIDDIRLYQQEP
jgi:hypothetical protein